MASPTLQNRPIFKRIWVGIGKFGIKTFLWINPSMGTFMEILGTGIKRLDEVIGGSADNL